uniref:Uncharacterized protein n=1 Tax=Ascaris lumbricoides TaxID=6252 RepID=A0A0M3HG29_ASCLU
MFPEKALLSAFTNLPLGDVPRSQFRSLFGDQRTRYPKCCR